MRYRLFLITSLLAIFVFTYQTLAFASLEVGLEYQPNNEPPNKQAFQMGYQFPSLWEIRGALEYPNNGLSIGIIREFETNSSFSPYLGIGLRDLNGVATPELSAAEKGEIIAGIKLKLVDGISVGLEGRFVPEKLSNPGQSLKPEIGVSLNYRFPSSGTAQGSRPPVLKINRADRRLLAQLVMVEAPDEPYKGQVAVAAVVFNRMKSGRFPETVPDVINEPGQFTSKQKMSRVEPDESAYRAVDDALQGVDPSHGAHYFYNPAAASKAGRRFFRSDNLKETARIGNHVFFKLR